MKKLMSLLLAILLAALLAVPAVASADMHNVEVDSALLKAFDLSITDWFEDETSRSVAASLCLLQCYISEDATLKELALQALVNDTIYLARLDADAMCVYLGGDKATIVYVYIPGSHDTAVGYIEDFPGDDVASFMEYQEANDAQLYSYRISSDNVVMVLEVIQDILEE